MRLRDPVSSKKVVFGTEPPRAERLQQKHLQDQDFGHLRHVRAIAKIRVRLKIRDIGGCRASVPAHIHYNQ
jgi:hypothetical protein